MRNHTAKIVISNLTKYYGKTLGVKDLSLEIYEGEIFGFLGPNGAGKTTTIRCMVNILVPAEGAVYIDGIQVSRDNPAIMDKVGYLPGELYFPKGFTVKNMLDYMESLKRKPCLRRKDLLKRFDLDEHKKIKALSHGNKQKLGIILAFMHDPEVLILDEPSTGLDPLLQQELYALLLEEKERGKTIFFSSHNLDEVQRVCDRVAIIREGHLVTVESVDALNKKVIRKLRAVIKGASKDIFENIDIEYSLDGNVVEFNIPDNATLRKVLKILSTTNVEDLAYPPASLEEYFLLHYNTQQHNRRK